MTLVQLAPPAVKPVLPKQWPYERLLRALDDAPRSAPWLAGCKHLQVEITNHCDLACVECPQRFMQRYRQGMTIDTFEAVLTKVVAGHRWESITLHKDGEPLLYKHIKDAFRTISQAHRGSFDLYTNGTHLTKEFYDFAASLPNKWRFLVSFHFHDPDGGRYSVERGTRVLADCLADPQPNIELIATTHLTKYASPAEAEEWRAGWSTYPNLTTHVNPNLNPWAGHIDGGTTTFSSCPYGSAEHLFIGVTGNVVPCCLDLNEDLALGNVVTDPLPEIMAKRAALYESTLKPETRTPLCGVCLSA